MQKLLWKWRGKRLWRIVRPYKPDEYRWMNGRKLTPKQVEDLEMDSAWP